MRIAILSMQRIVNFGSVLQAWSLRQLVKEVTGVEATFLDIEDKPALVSQEMPPGYEDYSAPVCYSQHVLQRIKRRMITLLSGYNKRLIRNFMQNELHLDDQNVQKEYEYVIIGSDEVFNHSKGIRLQLHGAVKQAKNVIAYAASCGSAKVEYVRNEDMSYISDAMNRFTVISVRDKGTERYVRHFYDKDIYRHMDPVLMGDLYARRVHRVWLKNYLLVYAYGHRIRTEEEINAIRDFARRRKLKIVALGGSQFWCDFYIPASPMRMLDWFAHADYVVTDTFHGVIFSVINQRKFVAIVRPSNVNKLTNLLADLNLSERKLTNPAMLESILDLQIDYDVVNAHLHWERARTKAYLKEWLADGTGAH